MLHFRQSVKGTRMCVGCCSKRSEASKKHDQNRSRKKRNRPGNIFDTWIFAFWIVLLKDRFPQGGHDKFACQFDSYVAFVEERVTSTISNERIPHGLRSFESEMGLTIGSAATNGSVPDPGAKRGSIISTSKVTAYPPLAPDAIAMASSTHALMPYGQSSLCRNYPKAMSWI